MFRTLAALREENAGITDNYFLSLFLTRNEGYRLLQVYGRTFDVVGISTLALIYLISLLVGAATCILLFFYAVFQGLFIMLRNAMVSFFDIRMWIVWLKNMGRRASGSIFSRLTLKKPRNAVRKSQAHIDADDEEVEEEEEEDDELEMLERGEADVPSSNCGLGVWASLSTGILKGSWESMRGREKERQSHVTVKKVDIINAAKVWSALVIHGHTYSSMEVLIYPPFGPQSYPDGLLSVLVEYDVESPVFGESTNLSAHYFKMDLDS